MKVKGCKHYDSKVIKMAGGGSVPYARTKSATVVSTMDKNPDGSQQYVRGKTKSEKLGTLIRSTDAAVENYRTARKKMNTAIDSGTSEEFHKASDDYRRKFQGRLRLGDAFIDELDRKDKK